jgi:hypothetical protein
VSSGDYVLGPRPSDDRLRDLWLQHGAGFVMFEDIRGYARARLAPGVDEATRAVAFEAIDHAMYGLMMVIDGIPGPFRNAEHDLSLSMTVTLRSVATDDVVESLELFDGDGVTLAFHGWKEGDFGEAPVTSGRRQVRG